MLGFPKRGFVIVLLTKWEAAMKQLLISGFLAMLYVTNCVAQDAPKVKIDRKGGEAKIKVEAVMAGYLADLNGKYKLRVTEGTYNPGGYIEEHHHVGPGIRVVTAGEWTTTQAGKTTIRKAGDAWFASGDVTSGVNSNKGKVPVVILNFEILPVDWKGGSAIPPKSKK